MASPVDITVRKYLCGSRRHKFYVIGDGSEQRVLAHKVLGVLAPHHALLQLRVCTGAVLHVVTQEGVFW